MGVTIHGMAQRAGRHRIYWVWSAMIQRCTNPKNKRWAEYGGRGITVCQEWHDARTFIQWATSHGWQPGLSIDRIENDGNYCPTNCEFTSVAKQNQHNRRAKLSADVVMEIKQLLQQGHPVSPIAKWFGVAYQTIWRIKVGKGWL